MATDPAPTLPGKSTAFGLLLAALSCSAGQGLYLLYFALYQRIFLAKFYEFGGLPILLTFAWFQLSILLFLGALLSRRRLLARSERTLELLALIAWLASLGVLATYLGLVVSY